MEIRAGSNVSSCEWGPGNYGLVLIPKMPFCPSLAIQITKPKVTVSVCGFKLGGNLFQVLISSKLDYQRCALNDTGCVMLLWVGRRINKAT